MTAPALRWMAYARWQLVDYLWQRLLLPLALAALLTLFTFYSVATLSSRPGFWAAPEGANFASNMLRQAMGTFIPLAVIMAMNGVVSHDRQKGYYRFYFSKPVPVAGFYLSAFAIHLTVASAAAGALTAMIGGLSAPQSVIGAIVACALTFVLLGSLSFVFSVITARGGLVFITALVVTLLTRQVEPGFAPGHWLHTAVRFLPPTHRLDTVRDALYAAQPLPINDLWHVLAYGGACLVLAVIALRTLALAR